MKIFATFYFSICILTILLIPVLLVGTASASWLDWLKVFSMAALMGGVAPLSGCIFTDDRTIIVLTFSFGITCQFLHMSSYVIRDMTSIEYVAFAAIAITLQVLICFLIAKAVNHMKRNKANQASCDAILP